MKIEESYVCSIFAFWIFDQIEELLSGLIGRIRSAINPIFDRHIKKIPTKMPEAQDRLKDWAFEVSRDFAEAKKASCDPKKIQAVIDALSDKKMNSLLFKRLHELPPPVVTAYSTLMNCQVLNELPSDLSDIDQVYEKILSGKKMCDRQQLALNFFRNLK